MENKQIDLRIHHFFDIIRAFGKESIITPHLHQHSFHKIAKLIKVDSNLKIKIVIRCDSVCEGCIYYKNGCCKDKVDHRKDFVFKEKFNNHIDKRIMEKCFINKGEVLTPVKLCQKGKLYLDNIDFIYSGNDLWHTEQRKKDVIKGLKYYSKLHNFSLQ